MHTQQHRYIHKRHCYLNDAGRRHKNRSNSNEHHDTPCSGCKIFCPVIYTNIFFYFSSLLCEHFTSVQTPARFPCNSLSPTREQNLLSLPGCERLAHLQSSKIAWCLLGSTLFTVEWRYSVALKSPLGQLPNLNNRNCWALESSWAINSSVDHWRIKACCQRQNILMRTHTYTHTHTLIHTHTLSSRPRVNTHLPSLLWVW